MNYKLINYCEFDKYATKAYSLIHNEPESKNLGDITKVNEKQLENFNVMTWGFPCTDISVAGKGKGFIDEDGNKTRSGLYYDGLRILQEKKPALSIIENVKNLTGKKFKDVFNQILKDLEDAGYNNYWQVLNAKDYGVPQNRERVFIISIRKDVDNGKFKFPKRFDNGIRLKDILEDIVDEKYYISQEKTDKLLEQLNAKNIGVNPCLTPDRVNKRQNGRRFKEDGEPAFTVNTQDKHGILQIGMLDIKGNEQIRRVYDPEGLSPTLNSMQGGNRQPKIIEDFYINREVREYEEYSPTLRADRQGLKVLENTKSPNPELVGGIGDINFGKQYRQGNRVYSSEKTAMCLLSQPVGNTGGNSYLYLVQDEKETQKMIVIGNTVPSKHTAGRVFSTEGISPTMMERHSKVIQIAEPPLYRIRKLTPLECFRLMGFYDQDYYILKENGISNSQIYKMAGNSIVVDVLYYILLELYKAIPHLLEDIKLSSFFSGIGAFEKAILRLQEVINKEHFEIDVINY